MQETTKAIVLSSIKYGDTSLIVKAFTASSGIKTYLLRGVLASKRGKLKSAYFQPLMQLEIIANHRNKGNLESIKEARVNFPYQTMHRDISKNALTLFLAEMLGNSIHEEEQNYPLFYFLEAALQWLDTHDNIANFHLFFLLELTKYLGFYPESENDNAMYFDLQEGEFTNRPTLNPHLSESKLISFKAFLGINFDAIHTVKLGKKDRQELLQSLVMYFELHLHGFKKPRSLAILNDVFN
ncbi:DNA repair protein RecO [Muriicola sp. Z0-33]|uniref:DNA repair protein RecO n=1 Tax=Muriicola sp. Z0-33 TaxID=2816957 RepID=UPI0022378212|nr:DNA repair protein RecO [Muriicola sp. Z0-33]MCW5514901.1 DNA repair protein RecO [Muriicola sp. Z0-33]